MNQAYDNADISYLQNRVEYDHVPSAPLFLKLFLFVAVFLLGLVSNNKFIDPVYLTVSQLAMVALAVATALFGFLGAGWKVRMPRETLLSTLFFAWCLTGVLVATHKDLFILYYGSSVKIMGLYLVIVNIVRSRKDFLWMCVAYVLLVLIFILLGAHQIQEGRVKDVIGRAQGLSGQSNSLAVFGIIAASCAMIWFTVSRNIIIKCFCIAMIPICIYLIIKSGSRSGMLGFMIWAGFLYVWYIRGRLKGLGYGARMTGFVVGVVFLVGVFLVFASGPFWYRVQRTFGMGTYGGQAAITSEGRALMAINGIQLMIRHPVFGVGFQQYPIAIAEVAPFLYGRGSHNTWIETGCSGGFPGLGLWFCAYLLLTLRAWRLWKYRNLPSIDRSIVAICMCFLAFWWFKSCVSWLIADKVTLPFVAGLTGYLVHLSDYYGYQTVPQYYDTARSDYAHRTGYDVPGTT